MQKMTFTEIYQKALLNCSVRAYPQVTADHVDVLFGGFLLPANSINVETTRHSVDESLIKITIDPVTADDFGLYEVIVNNGVGGDNAINVQLIEQGGSYFKQCTDIKGLED